MFDREKVIEGLECCIDEAKCTLYCPYWYDNGNCRSNMEADALALLKAQEARMGYWVEEPDRVNHWHCSNCGCPVGIASIAYRYCYACGAKMAEHPMAADGCGQAFSPD